MMRRACHTVRAGLILLATAAAGCGHHDHATASRHDDAHPHAAQEWFHGSFQEEDVVVEWTPAEVAGIDHRHVHPGCQCHGEAAPGHSLADHPGAPARPKARVGQELAAGAPAEIVALHGCCGGH